ncbi:arginine-tRNA-protein transferase 1 [Corynespora cassiicola Philippines]|uniref:arginyltransferase n=1 Tax=Corynespora cassiicola Philippines TaxID=1448308 RepID=A0A2T2N7I2_CORCC|nr:arginine-tRNA-protein transferase 1 [Corynespora cassiicola Philippines]
MSSLLSPLGYSSEGCGYCKDGSTGRRTPKSRASYYASSKSLTVDVYQGLVDRGWRRSGTILYKPDVLRHCCPHYTIRLPAADFVPAKEHRRAINRWNAHVLGDAYVKEAARLHPKSKEEKARQRNTFDLVSAVHESEYANVKRPPEPAHRFEVTLEPDSFSQEKYQLFSNYQQHVHGEKPSEISPSGFTRFLCNSPLKRASATVNGKEQLLGSYHQCYRLDGRLIAMGILDLLPHCVSGVYLVYHSDFEKWNFGKLSALREAALALEGGYQFYYMGYYIHSCAKMRYKGEYRPQHVLDPETYEWNPLDGELRRLLDKKPYVSLARERRLKAKAPPPPAADDDDDDDDQADNYSDYPHPTAAGGGDVVSDGTSLFDLRVPGLMTTEEIEEQLELGRQGIKVRGVPTPVEARRLVSWEDGDLRDSTSIKGIVGELVACVGAEVAKQVALDFS